MVKLNTEQANSVASLKAAKALFEETRGTLDAQYADALEAAKSNVRAAVKAARDRGVPQRQIHLSLGFQQIGQLENFLTDKRLRIKDTTLDRILNEEVAEAPPTQIVGIDDSVPRFVRTSTGAIEDGMGNFYEELHLNGQRYPYQGVVMSGDVLYINEIDDDHIPQEIYDIILEKYPTVLN